MTGSDLLHIGVFTATLALLARWCWFAVRQDLLIGLAFTTGVIARLGVGIGAYWISAIDWAPLRHLHTGDGFWQIAPDARYYFSASAKAADAWFAVDRGSASPTFVWLLSIGMRLAGISPPAVALFNTLVGAAACRLVLAALQPGRNRDARLPGRVLVGALACSPGLIVFSALGLKDQLTVFLVVLFCVGALWVLDGLTVRSNLEGRASTGVAMTLVAAALLGGVRAYVVVLSGVALGIGTLAAVYINPRLRAAAAARSGALLLLLWLAFILGAGPYYSPYGNMLREAVGWALPAPVAAFLTGTYLAPSSGTTALGDDPEEALDTARKGFVRSPGATSLQGAGTLPGLARRFTLMVLPVIPLRAAGLVEISGGRGLFGVADLDSVFNLGSMAVVLWLAVRLKGSGRHTAYVVYVATFVGILALPMAYVVTNFGTLFRLRLMPVAVVWLVLLAFSPMPAARNDAGWGR